MFGFQRRVFRKSRKTNISTKIVTLRLKHLKDLFSCSSVHREKKQKRKLKNMISFHVHHSTFPSHVNAMRLFN